MLLSYKSKKFVKLACLFLFSFLLIFLGLYFFVFNHSPVIRSATGKQVEPRVLLPKNNVYFKASELNQHSLQVISSDKQDLVASNDLNKKCNFLVFPLVNTGPELDNSNDLNTGSNLVAGELPGTEIKPVFSHLLAPNQEVSFNNELVKDQAYALYCGNKEGFDFEKNNFSILIFKEPASKVFAFNIENGKLKLSNSESNSRWIKTNTNQKVWFVVTNKDKVDFSFDLVARKEDVSPGNAWPIILHKKRRWPYLLPGKILVLGPMSFKKSFYALALSDPHCKSKCTKDYQFHLEVQ